MELRFLRANDFAKISNLALKILLTEESSIYSIFGLKTMLNFFSEEQILKRSLEESTSFYEFYSNDQFVGFGEFSSSHLVSLYIDKNFRKQQIGSKFMDYIIFNDFSYDKMTVYSSPRSIEFYSKCGFVQQSINCIINNDVMYMPMVKFLSENSSNS